MADPTPAPAPKSGWQTTELYLAMLALGMVGYGLHVVAGALPAIAATPNLPGWAAPLLGLTPLALTPIAGWVATKYASLRNELKIAHLSGDTPEAVDALLAPQGTVQAPRSKDLP